VSPGESSESFFQLGDLASSSVLFFGEIFMIPFAKVSTRLLGKVFLGGFLILSSVPVLSGCGGDSSGTKGVVEVDQAKVKADQDAMREAQEKAHQRPTGKPSH